MRPVINWLKLGDEMWVSESFNHSILSRLRCILPLFLLSAPWLVSNSGPLKEVLFVAISDTLSSETAESLSGWEPAGWNYARVSSKGRNDQIGALNLKALRWHALRSHPHDNVCSQMMCRTVRGVGNVMGLCQKGWLDDLVIKVTISKPKKNGALPAKLKIQDWYFLWLLNCWQVFWYRK